MAKATFKGMIKDDAEALSTGWTIVSGKNLNQPLARKKRERKKLSEKDNVKQDESI